MTGQQRWKQVRDLFDAALEQPIHLRDQFLAAQTPGDPRLAAEVRELLASYRESDHLLTQPAVRGLEALLPGADPPPPPPVPQDQAPTTVVRQAATDTGALVGRRVGQYRLVKKIGSSELGPLFAAARDGRQLEGQVAIRIMGLGKNTSQFLQRFLQERRLLCALNHPNIAGWLDGGVSDEGLSYLVMQSVEGTPLDAYCDEGRLETAPRLRLFRAVCEAVQYGHQHLVVHGDLQQANILVSPDGTPRVLNFGIARLLADPSEPPATTIADIRSLGVLLNKLVGAKGGDLEAICAAALQQNPGRRYASIDALARDIDACLNGLPVSAQPDSGAYRLRKFVDSNRSWAVAGGVIALLLGAAALVNIYSAGRVRLQMRAAENRLNDARTLTRFVMLELDDELRQGETAARRALATRLLAYLQKLSADASVSGDRALQRDAIEGFLKLAGIQGELNGASAGENQRQSYQMALQMADSLSAADSSNRDGAVLAAKANAAMASYMARSGNRKGAIPLYQRALALVEPFAGDDKAGAPLELQLEISRQLGSAEFHSGDFPKAIEHYRRAHAIGSRLMAASTANPMAQRAVAEALAGMAQVYTRQGKVEQALGQLSESVTIRERLLGESPSQPLAKREAAAASLAWGDALSAAGRRAEAISPYRRALTLAEELVRIDGRNRLYQRDLALSLERLAETLLQAGSRTEAHDATKRALEAWWPLVDTRDPLVSDLQRYVWLQVTTPFDDLRSPARALPYAQKLVETTKSADPATLDALARAYFGVGDAAKAAETERRALALLPPMQPGETPPALRLELEENLRKFSSVR